VSFEFAESPVRRFGVDADDALVVGKTLSAGELRLNDLAWTPDSQVVPEPARVAGSVANGARSVGATRSLSLSALTSLAPTALPVTFGIEAI
jgi:hypothetical protein